MRDTDKFSDEELVKTIRSNDQELYSLIIDRYQNKLLRYANNLIGNEHKAADAVQESFIKAFINLNSFDTKKKFSSWIYRIVHNETINHIKKYQKERPFPEGLDFESAENIEDIFEQRETIAKVENCLKKMPLLYSEPLALYHIEEKSYKEISDILRIPTGTVGTRINRAKILMKKICQNNQ